MAANPTNPSSSDKPRPVPPPGPDHRRRTAGITVAARLRSAGIQDIALLEPSDTHWYQPLWTLVGGGQAR